MKSAAVPALVAVLLAAAFALAQDKPAAGGRSGVLNMRECMDKAHNVWIADIEQELQKMQEAEAGRAIDLNPQERARIRTKILDHSNRRKLEVYTQIVRITGEAARERGFELVQRVDRMPVIESGDTDLPAQIDRRLVVHNDPAIDLTPTVLERINKEYAAKKK
jgi:Skp family chaperone for outer membrane proteins